MKSKPPSKEERLRRAQEQARANFFEDVARTRKHVAREGLCSIMNDTKWAEFLSAMQSLAEFTPSYRLKHVRADQPVDCHRDWSMLYPYLFAEWVDIDPMDTSRSPRKNRAAEIERALREHHVPFSREGAYLRVWGYVRPGTSPNWA